MYKVKRYVGHIGYHLKICKSLHSEYRVRGGVGGGRGERWEEPNRKIWEIDGRRRDERDQ